MGKQKERKQKANHERPSVHLQAMVTSVANVQVVLVVHADSRWKIDASTLLASFIITNVNHLQQPQVDWIEDLNGVVVGADNDVAVQINAHTLWLSLHNDIGDVLLASLIPQAQSIVVRVSDNQSSIA